jgi:hypothetical protein
VIVASRLDIRIREQEDGQDDGNGVPAGEDQAATSVTYDANTHVKVSMASPDRSGLKYAEKATMAGICSRHT